MVASVDFDPMAHLNLRERVIEATIAYLGTSSESASATFTHVMHESFGRASTVEAEVQGERRLTLEWRPREGARLNDCELSVRIVSVGSTEPTSVDAALVDVDGVVLVLDSNVDAEGHNERAIASVKNALARSPEKTVPVVVQLNQDAGETGVSLKKVAPGDWSYVVAGPGKGDGVMETLNRAVEVVVEAMRTPNGQAPGSPRAPAPRTPRTEGNPLLVALRQIVQSTVSEELSALEARIVATLDARRADASQEHTLEHLVAETNAHAAALVETRLVGAVALDDVVARVESVADDVRQMSLRMTRMETVLLEEAQRAATARDQAASRVNVIKLQSLVAADVTARCDALVREIRGARDDVSRTIIGATEPVGRLVEQLAAASRALVLRLEGIASLVQPSGTHPNHNT